MRPVLFTPVEVTLGRLSAQFAEVLGPPGTPSRDTGLPRRQSFSFRKGARARAPMTGVGHAACERRVRFWRAWCERTSRDAVAQHGIRRWSWIIERGQNGFKWDVTPQVDTDQTCDIRALNQRVRGSSP